MSTSKRSSTAVQMPVTVDGETKMAQVETVDPTVVAATPEPQPQPVPKPAAPRAVTPAWADPALTMLLPKRSHASAATPQGYTAFAAMKGEREPTMKQWFPTKPEAVEFAKAHRVKNPDREAILIWAKPCEGWELIVEGDPARRFVFPSREQCETMRARLAEVIPDLKAEIEPFVFVPKPKVEEPPPAA